MDAFYASVEQRDNPALKGRPVIVGGPPDSRGVVASCSYEARGYGIHSAMPSSRAFRLCPGASFVRGRFNAYREASAVINDIFKRYTDLVEPLSLDEAYLDVSGCWEKYSSATAIAQEIRRLIKKETGLTASAGVSYNKFLAKTASDFNKPDGITIVTPEKAHDFIENLPVRKIFGVGKRTEEKMKALGIYTGRDLKELSLARQIEYFGKAGRYFYSIVRGVDDRDVEPVRERKSVGKEKTFRYDLQDMGEMSFNLKIIADEIFQILAGKKISGHTLTLKVKYHDFQQVTRSVTLHEIIYSSEKIFSTAQDLLSKTEAVRKPVRLLGISLSGLSGGNKPVCGKQLTFDFN